MRDGRTSKNIPSEGMKMNTFFCYPEGRKKALTLSYDDGTIHDRRLVGIFNQYGLKASFHLNSARFGMPDIIVQEEVKALYRGHEVSCHGANHNIQLKGPRDMVISEIWKDREVLEELCGYPVCGMSYPNNSFDEDTIARLRAAGIRCSGTTESTGWFDWPRDFLRWNPSCHHSKMLELLPRFLDFPYVWDLALFFVWGHSYEFNNNNNWEIMEEFAEKVSGKDDVWYATNIEICRYINAIHNLTVSADGRTFCNFSSIPVWLSYDGKLYTVKSGATLNL